ncbi:MAG: Crp/Fnr family transcriptional regulator [Bdellovibrionota bacterium]
MITADELRNIPLLAGIPDVEIVELAKVLKERRAPKGSFIVYAEDPGPSMMFIAEGKVKINLTSKDGKEVVLATLAEGDFFGEVALLTGSERSANVVATTECRLYVLNEEDFNRHLSLYTGFARVMLRELALRLKAASTKIGDLALYDVYRRVARTLKSMATGETRDGKEVFVISSRPTHQELAAMVGTSREMVTRALKGLEEDRCIVITGKRIELWKLPL